MTRTYRLGVLGFAHGHAFGLTSTFNQLPNIEWVACADMAPMRPSLMNRTQRAYERFHGITGGQGKIYADYREMLAQEQLDIVIFTPENARHQIACAAIAETGAAMVTEKPMAANLSQALDMKRTLDRTGTAAGHQLADHLESLRSARPKN